MPNNCRFAGCRDGVVRTVKTASGAVTVQVVCPSRRTTGARQIEHIGSAHDADEVAVLKAAARAAVGRLQQGLDLRGGRPGQK